MANPSRKMSSSPLLDWLNLKPPEFRGFLFATLTLFCISLANVLFANFAETVFLKRFGIHHLPTLIFVNALVTFAVMSLISRALTRFTGQVILSRVLLFSALAAGLTRLAVPFAPQMLYPLVYVMKTQFELVLTFLFWNLANQVFSTRQSKRMFPLMVSGGLIGGLCGSLATPLIARLGTIDSILWVYLIALLLAVLFLGQLSSAVTSQGGMNSGEKAHKGRSSLVEDLRRALPLWRGSGLVRWLVLLTLIPNMIVPLLNYQVSFAVDMTYPNEEAMIGFFGLYRGVQLGLALLLSLFSGRIYSRFGLSGGLLVHPVNYLLVFVIFILQFDLLTAVYAGISVGVIRRAIQTPARAALIGLFPNEQRVMLMPFLRGVVVRFGTLVGASFVFVCQAGYFAICRFPLHPQNLAPFGFGFAALWLFVALRMRKCYPELVLETLGWSGPERGRIKLSKSTSDEARTDLALIRRKLVQAAAVTRLPQQPAVDCLADFLAESAAKRSLEVLRSLEGEEPSGRLDTICRALEGDDVRNRANAVEALEQLIPPRLSRGLVRGLENNQKGIKPLPRAVLQELLDEGDSEITDLVRQIKTDGGR